MCFFLHAYTLAEHFSFGESPGNRHIVESTLDEKSSTDVLDSSCASGRASNIGRAACCATSAIPRLEA